MTVRPRRVVLTTELPGRTSPYLIAEIRPQASGIIQKRLFTEGADVKAGDVLYEIDPSAYQAAYANAKAVVAVAKAGHASALAARDAAKAALVAARAAQSRAEANAVPLRLRAERFRALAADKAVSQQDFDDTSAALKQVEAEIKSAVATVRGAEANIVRAEAAIQVAGAEIQSAEAGLETARINLGYTRITAPISGRIGRSAVTTGALVTAHQPAPLATIQQLDPIYVDVPQSTAELLRLQRRMADGRLSHDGTSQKAVQLILEDGTAYPHEGTLQFRDVSVDPTTDSVILRMVFPNPDRALLPGMFVRTVVEEGVNDQAILIPQQAVSRDPKGGPLAMIADTGGVAQMRRLTLDRAIGDKWLVTSGLAPGDRLIVEGLQRVRPGAPVKVVPFAAGEKENASPANASQPAPKAN